MHLDLLASRFNTKLDRFASRIRDPRALAVDAVMTTWDQFSASAFFMATLQDLGRSNTCSGTVPGPFQIALLPFVRSDFITIADFNGMPFLKPVFRDRGVLDSVIPTLIKARKATSWKIYHRTGKSYIFWCEENHFHLCHWLAIFWPFFKLVKIHLALSTIKGQTSGC